VTLDEDKDDDDDLSLDLDGLPVVIEKGLHESLADATIALDPEKGIMVILKTP